jgi:hypothetical protein
MAIKLHERTFAVKNAKIQIESQVSKIASEADLTYGELFSILSQIMLSTSTYLIRLERHDDASEPGDKA